MQEDLRNGDQAVELAERLVSADGSGDPIYLNTLAAAYAEAGRFEEATQNGERPVQRAREVRQRGIEQFITRCLEFYRRQEPYRDKGAF